MARSENHNETVLAARPALRGMNLGNHNETVIAQPGRYPSEAVRVDRVALRGMDLGNHNETVVASVDRADSRVRSCLGRGAMALAVLGMVGGLLGFGSSPGDPGGVVLAKPGNFVSSSGGGGT